MSLRDLYNRGGMGASQHIPARFVPDEQSLRLAVKARAGELLGICSPIETYNRALAFDDLVTGLGHDVAKHGGSLSPEFKTAWDGFLAGWAEEKKALAKASLAASLGSFDPAFWSCDSRRKLERTQDTFQSLEVTYRTRVTNLGVKPLPIPKLIEKLKRGDDDQSKKPGGDTSSSSSAGWWAGAALLAGLGIFVGVRVYRTNRAEEKAAARVARETRAPHPPTTIPPNEGE